MPLNVVNCVIIVIVKFADYFDFHGDMDYNMLHKHQTGLGGDTPDISL